MFDLVTGLMVVIAITIISYFAFIRPIKRAEQEQKRKLEALILERLKGKVFSVVARQRDGKKTSFEAFLIDALLSAGAVVRQLDEVSAQHALQQHDKHCAQEGTCVLVGRAWTTSRPTVFNDVYSFDFRLISSDGDVIAAYLYHDISERETAKRVVLHLAKTFLEPRA